jgi:hypothetical protein
MAAVPLAASIAAPAGASAPLPRAPQPRRRGAAEPIASLPEPEISHPLFVSFGNALQRPCSHIARTRPGVFNFYFLQIGFHRPYHPCAATWRTQPMGENHPAGTRNALKYGRAPALSPRRRSSVTGHDSADSRDASPLRVAAARRVSPSISRRSAWRPSSHSALCSARSGGRDTPRVKGYPSRH